MLIHPSIISDSKEKSEYIEWLSEPLIIRCKRFFRNVQGYDDSERSYNFNLCFENSDFDGYNMAP